MEPAQEKMKSGFQEESFLEDLLAKAKAVAKGPHGELFARIVEDFYEQVTEEYFSPEDLAGIQEGIEEIRRGEHISWEECKRKHGLGAMPSRYLIGLISFWGVRTKRWRPASVRRSTNWR